MLGEEVVCATVSPHLYGQMQCYLPPWQLCCNLRDFSNGVCGVMKTAVADSNAGLESPYLSALLFICLGFCPEEIFCNQTFFFKLFSEMSVHVG